MASRASRRVFSSDTPSPCAIRSPSASMLSEGDSPMARTKPAAAAHRALRSVCTLIPARSPASQVRMASSVCSSRINTAAVIDEANADIATPHSVTFIGVSPVRPDEENISTSKNSAAAPAAATSGRPNGSDSPSALVITTASAAPALSPRICGSPSGLRITDCSSTPATPSAAPVTIAAQRRSSLNLIMTLWSKLRGSKWKNASTTVCGAMKRAPMPRCIIAPSASSSAKIGKAREERIMAERCSGETA